LGDSKRHSSISSGPLNLAGRGRSGCCLPFLTRGLVSPVARFFDLTLLTSPNVPFLVFPLLSSSWEDDGVPPLIWASLIVVGAFFFMAILFFFDTSSQKEQMAYWLAFFPCRCTSSPKWDMAGYVSFGMKPWSERSAVFPLPQLARRSVLPFFAPDGSFRAFVTSPSLTATLMPLSGHRG